MTSNWGNFPGGSVAKTQASNAGRRGGGVVSNPGQGTGSHMSQLLIRCSVISHSLQLHGL